MRTSRIWDGLLLILLGVFLLALNQGWVSLEVASGLVRQFWPVILIVLGVLIVVFGRGASFGVLVIVALALAAVAVIGPANTWFRMARPHMWGDANLRVETEAFSEELQGATETALSVNFGAGRLTIDGNSQKLAEARLDWTSVKPSWVVLRAGTKAEITVGQGNDERTPAGGAGLNWKISVNESTPLDLTANLGAGRVDLNLNKTKLRRLDLSVGAGDLRISFPEQPEMRASIKSGASSIELTIPRATGIRINSSNPLISAALTREGLERRGDSYVSKEFGQSESNLEIDLSAGVSSVKIRRQ